MQRLETKYALLHDVKRQVPGHRWQSGLHKFRAQEAVATSLFEKVAIPSEEHGRGILMGLDLPCAEDAKRELQNSLSAIHFMRKQKEMNVQLIKEVQGILMGGLNELRPASEQITVGEWKKTPNSIGGKLCLAPQMMPELMEAYVEWLNGDAKQLHPVEAAWVAQYIFVHIHPFDDGNGRTSRLIAQFVLDNFEDGKYSGFGMVSLSSALNDNRMSVMKLLNEIGQIRDLTRFIDYMTIYQCQAVDAAIAEAEKLKPANYLKR